MQLTKDEINTIWSDCQDTGNATRESIAAAVIATHAAKVLEDVEPFMFEEYPYNSHAMGCGLEDRDITDRYEAMAYGWDRAMERAAEAIPDDLYPAHTVAALKSRADALAPKAGFVMVPRDGVEQIADALADVLATFQHAEPEALKAAIRHSNKSAHAAYTLVYGLLFAAQPGAQESAK